MGLTAIIVYLSLLLALFVILCLLYAWIASRRRKRITGELPDDH